VTLLDLIVADGIVCIQECVSAILRIKEPRLRPLIAYGYTNSMTGNTTENSLTSAACLHATGICGLTIDCFSQAFRIIEGPVFILFDVFCPCRYRTADRGPGI
jgi:hypothetical protein